MKIINVEKEKEMIRISLETNKSFLISLENYFEMPLVIGNEISKKQIEAIVKNEAIVKTKKAAYLFMKKKRRSKKEVELFLLEQGLSQNEAKVLIDNFVSQYFINDNELIDSIININLYNLKGKSVIKEKLLKREISVEDIDAALNKINIDEYNANIIKQIKKHEKRYANDSNYIKINKIRLALSIQGYEKSLIESNLNMLDSYDDEKEQSNAQKDLMKILKSYVNKGGYNENEEKIKAKLINKGYKYDIIKKVIREVFNNETN